MISDMFELYTEEKKIFMFEDYAVLKKYARNKKKALEFGPGISTLALIEAGVKDIHTCEYKEEYYLQAKDRFSSYPQVHVHRYKNLPRIAGPQFQEPTSDSVSAFFDIGFVDSPIGSVKHGWEKLPGQEKHARLNTLHYAVTHCSVVVLHDAKRPGEQCSLGVLESLGYKVKMIDTTKGMAVIC